MEACARTGGAGEGREREEGGEGGEGGGSNCYGKEMGGVRRLAAVDGGECGRGGGETGAAEGGGFGAGDGERLRLARHVRGMVRGVLTRGGGTMRS